MSTEATRNGGLRVVIIGAGVVGLCLAHGLANVSLSLQQLYNPHPNPKGKELCLFTSSKGGDGLAVSVPLEDPLQPRRV